MGYEVLIEKNEPIDGWSICTVCLQVDRTEAVLRKRWRCSDCGSENINDLQQPLRSYLTANPLDQIEKNLQEWSNVKGMRPAYKMLKSARYKCLMTLSRREAS